jgi:hypothetical protein
VRVDQVQLEESQPLPRIYSITWELIIEGEIDDAYVRNCSNTAMIQREVERKVPDVISTITAEEDRDLEGENSDDQDVSPSDQGAILKDWIMSVDTFDFLCPKLPKWYQNFKVIIDLEEGMLHIRAVPGALHGTAATAFNYTFESWANNFMPVPPGTTPPLRSRNDASGYPRLFLWLMQIDCRYDDRSSKSPDNSYVPRGILIPPAKLIPGTNIPYPTVVVEVGHRNESWRRLKRDARTKAFAPMTSIQVLIAIKIYTAHFRVFWASRSMTGVGMRIEHSPKLDIQTPTNLSITIPKTLVF